MRLLFFPSSSAAMGYGEIARCSIIAEECRRRYPGTEVLFLLDGRRSKKPMYDLPHSYFHGGKKAQDQRFEQLCESFRPDVAVFDCQLS